ncbi:MAG: hypothetical protein HUK22_01760 [Thermoguttaceae bacterium]|nr:hypothetical protein [Thermoguttaceae bacterium]
MEIWNIANNKRDAALPIVNGKVFSLEYCGADRIAAGDSLNRISVWDVNGGALLGSGSKTLAEGGDQWASGHSGTIAVLLYDPQDDTVLSGSFDTTLIKWNIPKIR